MVYFISNLDIVPQGPPILLLLPPWVGQAILLRDNNNRENLIPDAGIPILLAQQARTENVHHLCIVQFPLELMLLSRTWKQYEYASAWYV